MATRLLHTWDAAPNPKRATILTALLQKAASSSFSIDQELGPIASLFLTRLNAHLRLTYLNHPPDQTLNTIELFLNQITGTTEHLHAFLQTGGLLTLLDIITTIKNVQAIKVLQTVSMHGRKYKEFICDSNAIRIVSDCMSNAKEKVIDSCRCFLSTLGTGNPKYVGQVFKGLMSVIVSNNPTSQHHAGQALRSILPNIAIIHSTVLEPTFALLRSTFLKVQYEGYQLLVDFLRYENLQDSIIHQLVQIITTDSKKLADFKRRKSFISSKGALMEGNMESQQLVALKVVNVSVATFPLLVKKFIKAQLVQGLLLSLTHAQIPVQKQSAQVLYYLCDTEKEVGDAVKSTMGNSFYAELMQSPDTFWKELTKEQVSGLQKSVAIDEEEEEEEEEEKAESVTAASQVESDDAQVEEQGFLSKSNSMERMTASLSTKNSNALEFYMPMTTAEVSHPFPVKMNVKSDPLAQFAADLHAFKNNLKK